MHFVHWKVPFGIIAVVMDRWRCAACCWQMLETVQRGAVPFSAVSVLRDFRNVLLQPDFFTGAATLSLSFRYPDDELVAVSPVSTDAGGMSTSQLPGRSSYSARGDVGQYDCCAPG